MEKIRIKCTTGITMSLDEMNWFPRKLKKHSDLEIQRIRDSIIEDGFLFPIAIGKVGDKNYIIDGECTYNALQQLKYEGCEIPEIPIYYVRCNEKTIKKMILIGTSTNHCVTETSLKEFVKGTDLNLKNYGFSDSDLIDFHSDVDIGLYIQTKGGKFSEQKLNEEDFGELLK